jgi:hypothetical protein
VSVPSRPPPDPASLYVVDFEVRKEGWSWYQLDDGNKIRSRVILVSVRAVKPTLKKGEFVAPETSITVKVDSPPNRRGPKGSNPTPEELSDPKGHGGEEVEINNSNEPWNEYRVGGNVLRLQMKLVLNRVWRLKDRFDPVGDPVYVVNFGVNTTIEMV